MPRWVLVDDTDSGIQYTGPWFEDQSSQDSLGNYGIPYLSTLHGINSDGVFSYTFQGSRVLITGTLQFPITSSASEGPSWQCIVDGVPTPSLIYTTAENRLRFCEQDGLEDGVPHTIVVNATVPDQRTFWFDYIQYLPSADVPLDNAALSIDIPDPQMSFGAGWGPLSPGYMTAQTGATFSFPFSGVSITWFGFYDNSLPMAATTATYAIDGGEPTTFGLNGISALSTGVQYNQIFFQTPQLQPGEHTLEVVYQGNSQTTPLTVSVVYLQNGTASSSASTSSSESTTGNGGSAASVSSALTAAQSGSVITTPGFGASSVSSVSSTSTSTPFPTSPSGSDVSVGSTISKSARIGFILGGTLLALIIVFLIFLGLYRYQKRRSMRRANESRGLERPMTQVPQVDPYLYASASAAHTSRGPISPGTVTSSGVDSGPAHFQHAAEAVPYADPFQDQGMNTSTASHGIDEIPRGWQSYQAEA